MLLKTFDDYKRIDVTPGQKVIVFETNWCQKAPNDLKLDSFCEGVVESIEDWMPANRRFWYRISRIVCSGNDAKRSWMLGKLSDFYDKSHFVRVIESNQLFLF